MLPIFFLYGVWACIGLLPIVMVLVFFRHGG